MQVLGLDPADGAGAAPAELAPAAAHEAAAGHQQPGAGQAAVKQEQAAGGAEGQAAAVKQEDEQQQQQQQEPQLRGQEAAAGEGMEVDGGAEGVQRPAAAQPSASATPAATEATGGEGDDDGEGGEGGTSRGPPPPPPGPAPRAECRAALQAAWGALRAAAAALRPVERYIVRSVVYRRHLADEASLDHGVSLIHSFCWPVAWLILRPAKYGPAHQLPTQARRLRTRGGRLPHTPSKAAGPRAGAARQRPRSAALACPARDQRPTPACPPCLGTIVSNLPSLVEPYT
jgi:hypothetical protein